MADTPTPARTAPRGAGPGRGGRSGGPGGQRGRKGAPRGRGERRGVTTSQPEYESKTLALDRVSRMQAGGRRFRFRAVVGVGNRKGTVGLGIGKAPDVRSAIEKATRRAHENKVTIPRKGGTIPREVEIKLGTSRIIMRPARAGHGVVAGGVVRTIFELAGITDVSTKILSRSSNNLSNARATIAGLERLSERVAVAKARKALVAERKAKKAS